ncbi:MAG: 3-deoxy-D-manno-octulosonate 8-phosphate phosphatase [Chlorobium sp.]|uniref:KdsC family phosphatase n=1 Tax=Chlorobium sp. TaxID=1095 RepID=UPI0025BF16FC|nr:3-deoxy-D-manno-octulosonate 8-phosphate phosphatase [Chlorobium sp.]MCF8383768.1 3-deoxy-D-manno-octulosonate 8-phosphate phosphatase [Chlorobium sp.]
MEPSLADPSSKIQQALQGVRAIVFPVDGVLNGPRMTFDCKGGEIISISNRDASALKEALRHGLLVAVVSDRDAGCFRPVLESLGITSLYLEASSLLEAYEAFRQERSLQDEECAYIGDDIADVPVLEKAGFPVTPIDGADYLRNRVGYISAYEGGKGCIREIVEMVLQQQGKWLFADNSQE